MADPPFNGHHELAQFLMHSKAPTFEAFCVKHAENLPSWSIDAGVTTTTDLYALWRSRFAFSVHKFRPMLHLKPSKYEGLWEPMFSELQQLRRTTQEYRLQALRTLEAAGPTATHNTVTALASSSSVPISSTTAAGQTTSYTSSNNTNGTSLSQYQETSQNTLTMPALAQATL